MPTAREQAREAAGRIPFGSGTPRRSACADAASDVWEPLVRDLLHAWEGDCRYDHHGYCQAHFLHERPCPAERAKEALGG